VVYAPNTDFKKATHKVYHSKDEASFLKVRVIDNVSGAKLMADVAFQFSSS
jgi:hypothetical protein